MLSEQSLKAAGTQPEGAVRSWSIFQEARGCSESVTMHVELTTAWPALGELQYADTLLAVKVS